MFWRENVQDVMQQVKEKNAKLTDVLKPDKEQI
jgi:hypothetical protein